MLYEVGPPFHVDCIVGADCDAAATAAKQD
jgi:hypothetical protein